MNPAQLRRVNVESLRTIVRAIDLLLDAVGYGASVGFMADLDALRPAPISMKSGKREQGQCCSGWWSRTNKCRPACN
jgi:hypothetical protein